MTLGPHNVNTYGVAQGGSLYTLADVAIGFMILKRLEDDQKVFTLEMKMNFIKKGAGAYLTATPTILRWGKTTVVAECTIEDSEGELVAKALGTFYVARLIGGIQMKEIMYAEIVHQVELMCQKANFDLGEDVYTAFKKALQTEKSDTGKEILSQLVENADIAKRDQVSDVPRYRNSRVHC